MKNKDDLLFYSNVLEIIKEELKHVYNIKDVTEKKLKYILYKCGYKQENVENASTVANRSYSIDHNIVKYYRYIN